FRVPLDVPWCDLDQQHRRMVEDGFGEFTGIRGWFDYLSRKRYKMHYRILLARYRGYATCPSCHGTRLRASARSYWVGGRTIAVPAGRPVGESGAWLADLPAGLGAEERAPAAPLIHDIDTRLAYLEAVGLSYVTLIRQTRTLSGGEAQRIHLAQALGAQL